MSRACGETIGPRIRICRFVAASGRCSGSNRPDQHNGSCPSMPQSRTHSTSNVISFPAIRSALSEAKRFRVGGRQLRPEQERALRLLVRPAPSSRDNPQRGHGCRRIPGGFWRTLGCPLTQDEWAEVLRAAVTPIDETLTLAASVRRQARVAVLTNNNLLVKRAVNTVFPEPRPIFGRNFFVSAEFHARKPEPEAYLRCLARVGAAADVTLFVDDSVKNVSGAERAGLRAHLYRSPEGLERVLSAEGLL
jgi:HAD superfamily hydrolase (TIGR01509 family)